MFDDRQAPKVVGEPLQTGQEVDVLHCHPIRDMQDHRREVQYCSNAGSDHLVRN